MGQQDPFTRMTPGEARTSMEEVAKDIHGLTPDSIITLFEIDISEIKKNLNLNQSILIEGDILAFHNMEILEGKKIKYDGHTYYAMPILMEGFEMSSSGELPRPTMMMTSMRGVEEAEKRDPNNYVWPALRSAVLNLDNLIGAKVTRIRTLAKYLDAANEIPNVAQSPDPNAQFPRETYFVDSKTKEDKNAMSFELASYQDMENFKLPGRFVLSSRCPFLYRGEGCCYEFKETSSPELLKQKEIFGATDHLPDFAPPIATENDEKISEIISTYNPDNVTLTSIAEYNPTHTYSTGAVVYIEKNGLKYYFVAKGNYASSPAYSQPVPAYAPPPNINYWAPDRCSKTLRGCKQRFGTTGSAKNAQGASKTHNNKFLNFGGFPGTNTRISV